MAALAPDLLSGALGVVAATLFSFILITLVSSYYRFENIVEQADGKLSEDAMVAGTMDILRVQLARHITGCARRSTSLAVFLVHQGDSLPEVRTDSTLFKGIGAAARHEDVVCVYDQHTIALLAEAEPEDSEAIIKRIVGVVSENLSGVNEELFRIGISSYPGHGLSGRQLLKVASEGLAQATVENPVVLPEIEEELDEEIGEEAETDEGGEVDENPEVATDRRYRREKNILDELTGVLKPSVLSSYMQRMMSQLRQKKKPSALFCIGVNNIGQIARVHGEEAVDDVLVDVSRILQENLRTNDLIGRHEKTAFLVLLDASLEESAVIGRRISTLVKQSTIITGGKKIKVDITLGVAAHPEHGRNLHSLYVAGQKVLDYNRANDIRAYAVYDPAIHDSMPSKPMRSIKSIKA